MKYDSDTAKVDRWHKTSKEDCERGYERLDPPGKDGSNNERQLEGGEIPRKDPVGR
jgi:hypothetical protein